MGEAQTRLAQPPVRAPGSALDPHRPPRFWALAPNASGGDLGTGAPAPLGPAGTLPALPGGENGRQTGVRRSCADFFVFCNPPPSLSSLSISQAISANVPSSLPLGPDQFSFSPSSVSVSVPFSLHLSLLPSLQSLYRSPRHFLPVFCSLSSLVVSLTHVVNTCIPVGVFYPPALSSILRVPVPFSPRISFLLDMLAFRSLTSSPTVSSLSPVSSSFFLFPAFKII